MPDRGPDHANPVLHHHRDVKLVKTAGIFRLAVMQLTDGLDRDTGILQLMAPPPRCTGIGAGIVPVTGLVDIATGREGGARRHTDRRRRIGVGEPDAAFCKRVEVGCPNEVMAGTAHGIETMLVRDDHQKISHDHSGVTVPGFPAFRTRHRGGRENRAGLRAPLGRMAREGVTVAGA